MGFKRHEFSLTTSGRGSLVLDREIRKAIQSSDFTEGLLHVFCQHTSASLMICENADPTVRRDLERFMADLVPDGDPRFLHQDEGPDDMPAHVRSILTQTELTVPVSNGKLQLGVWQSIFLWEHRTSAHQRRIVISMMGSFNH